MGHSCSRNTSVKVDKFCSTLESESNIKQENFSWILPYVTDIDITESGVLKLILNGNHLPNKQIPDSPIFIEGKELIKGRTSFSELVFGDNGHHNGLQSHLSGTDLTIAQFLENEALYGKATTDLTVRQRQEIQISSGVTTTELTSGYQHHTLASRQQLKAISIEQSKQDRKLVKRSFIVRISPLTDNTKYIRYHDGNISVGRSYNPDEIEWRLTNFTSYWRYTKSELETTTANRVKLSATSTGSVIAQENDSRDTISGFILIRNRNHESFRMQLENGIDYSDKQLHWERQNSLKYQENNQDDERYDFHFYFKAICVIQN